MASACLVSTTRPFGIDMILAFNPQNLGMFHQMGATPERSKNLNVSLKEYQQWRQSFIFEALRGESYGASFCKYFEIHDYILRFDKDVERCDEYIKRLYLDK